MSSLSRNMSLFCICWFICILAICRSYADPQQPENLTIFHRSGQSFLTWTENAIVFNETYRVYRHTEEIDASNIDNAEMIASIPENSSYFRQEATHETPVQTRFIIVDLGSELSPNTGIFVNTAHENRTVFYAVTCVDSETENRTDFSSENASGLIAESVADPQPVLVWQSPSGYGRIYTQFMDYHQWNWTFEGYAYNYNVAVPPGYAPTMNLPLYVYLHGWGGRYAHDASTPYDWPAIVINIDDPGCTWYYGFSATYDYRQSEPPTPADSGPIANFTEYRILRAISDTMANTYYRIDPERIYAHGQSMGGSGSLSLALRYPNVFAAIFGGQPMTDYLAADDWREDLIRKFGDPASQLPIVNLPPYSAHLQKYNGVNVWTWMNHVGNSIDLRGEEAAFISIQHGTLDPIIEWNSQGAPIYGALFQAFRGFSGAVEPVDHTWMGFSAECPNFRFEDFDFRKDETFPAFGHSDGCGPIPPGDWGCGPFCYNTKLEWSSSWNEFAGPPIDQGTFYSLAVRSTEGTQRASITPRRVKNLSRTPGNSYRWRNMQLPDETEIESGYVELSVEGLITIPDFLIAEQGDRLEITLHSGPTPTPTPDASPTPDPVSVTLLLPQTTFHANDNFYLDATIDNSGTQLSGTPLFVVLNLYDRYWCWPSWTEYNASSQIGLDYEAVDAGLGTTTIAVIEPFIWPSGVGAAHGILLVGFLTDPPVTRLLGTLDIVEFGYE